MNRTEYLAAISLLLCLLSCVGGNDGGAVEVRVSGQEFVRTGWPTVDGDDLVEFNDKWDVKFEHVVLGISAFALIDDDDSIVSNSPSVAIVDVRSGDADLWALTNVEAKRWPNVGYRFEAPGGDAEVVGDVPDDIVKAMRDGNLSMWLEGTGSKEGQSVHFTFAISSSVSLHHCWNGNDNTDGIVVGEGRTSEVELTLHMDHLFWDDHDADMPRLLFGPLAYAANEDGELTLNDLESQRLSDLKDADGSPLVDNEGKPIVYVPRVQLSDNNLKAYVIDTALTVGHFNGEGHCSYTIVN